MATAAPTPPVQPPAKKTRTYIVQGGKHHQDGKVYRPGDEIELEKVHNALKDRFKLKEEVQKNQDTAE